MNLLQNMRHRAISIYISAAVLVLICGCHPASEPQKTVVSPAHPSYFKVDPATAGTLSGKIRFSGKRSASKAIDMSEDPACVEAYREAYRRKPHDESEVTGSGKGLANVFIFVKSGLEGKTFEIPATPVTIDQRGCWFSPRVLGIQTGQVLSVVNSDPVTHNIHPMAHINREWNHSQGQGDPPLARKFIHPEIMIPVKCNIHSWMHAFIGVVDHPYFAVSDVDGSFKIPNLPPGNYVIEAWHEKLGTQEQKITIPPSGKATIDFTFKGE